MAYQFGLYSLLLRVPALKEVQWNFLGEGQHNYLLPFIISSLVAIISNYLMNRISTFKGWKEQKSGFGRYMAMGIATLFLDMGLLVLFVRLWKFPYVPAAALAILIAFVVRFVIARSWVWKNKSTRKTIALLACIHHHGNLPFNIKLSAKQITMEKQN